MDRCSTACARRWAAPGLAGPSTWCRTARLRALPAPAPPRRRMLCAATSSGDYEDLSGHVRQRVEDARAQQPPEHLQRLGSDTLFHPERRLTDTIIAGTVAIYIVQVLTGQQLTLLGLKVNMLIDAGQWWRLLTPALLHGSPAHLVMNCLSLSALGPGVEWTMGRQRMALVYVVAAFGGNLASYWADPEPSLGASGAIFGLAGALLVYFVRNRPFFNTDKADNIIKRLVLTIVINLVVGLALPNIDEWGHLGGMAGGALVAALLGPRYELVRAAGLPGVYVVDEPPLPVPESWSTRPRRVL